MSELLVEKQQGVPEGYKLTEVGVIPEDWEVYEFGEVLISNQLGGNYANSEKETEYPLIKMGNVNRGNISLNKIEYVNFQPSEKDRLHFGDVLFNTRNTLDLVGKVAVWRGELPQAYFNSNLMRLKFNSLHISSDFYMNAVMNSDKFITDLAEVAIGTTSVAAIYTRDLFKIKFALAPLEEQTAIATALSDVDELLASLEALIAKKQAIKTATMQQLLSGRTRLPQFALREDGSPKGYKPSELGEIPEDWEVREFQELGLIDPENLPSTTPPNYQFEYISLEQVDMGVLLGTNRYCFSSSPSRARRVLRKNDVLISTVRPNLLSHYIVQDEVRNLICSTGFSVIRVESTKICAGFLYQHLFSTTINKQIETLITGSNYPAISSRDVKDLKIQIGQIEEQTAIATILSDMDAELEALEKQLSKTQQIKQGMMQQLLTGKIRLVKPN